MAVSAEIMEHIAQVESSANPLAIGVVGGRLEHQPRSLAEAVATARMLESKGYDYSLGIAQINRRNLVRYGLDTFAKAFDGCANLVAGARILAGCHARSGGDWGKAFSCYYSGDFTTGYRDGYVQRVYAAINAVSSDTAEPITVHPQTRERANPALTLAYRRVDPRASGSRILMRTAATDSTAGALVSALTQEAILPSHKEAAPASQPTPETLSPVSADPANGAFVPHVSGPGRAPPFTAAAVESPRTGDVAASTGQPAASNQDFADAAFVF
jgi:type IV secretion system protein VirB1